MTDEEIKEARAVIDASRRIDFDALGESDTYLGTLPSSAAEFGEAARTGWPAALDALEEVQKEYNYFTGGLCQTCLGHGWVPVGVDDGRQCEDCEPEDYEAHALTIALGKARSERDQLKAEQRLNEPDFTRLKAEVERLKSRKAETIAMDEHVRIANNLLAQIEDQRKRAEAWKSLALDVIAFCQMKLASPGLQGTRFTERAEAARALDEETD